MIKFSNTCCSCARFTRTMGNGVSTKSCSQPDPSYLHSARRERENFPDEGVDVEPHLRCLFMLEHRTGISKHLIGAMAIFDDVLQRASYFVEVWRCSFQPVQSRTSSRYDRSQRLPDFVSDGSGQFARGRYAD